MDIEKLFYEWAATYGSSKEDADRSMNGKELMIEFAEMVLKESDSLPCVSDFTLEEMQKAVAYGFWYATESQNSGCVPVGNFLQWVLNQREMIEIPKEWDDFMKKNGYAR